MRTRRLAAVRRGGRAAVLVMAAVMVLTLGAGGVLAKTAKEINAGVNACLERFYQQVKGGKEMAPRPRGSWSCPA